MGNSATKEQGAGRDSHRHAPSEATGGDADQTPSDLRPPAPPQHLYSSRTGRSSRPDLSLLLGIGGSSDRDVTNPEARRETKQEREARRLERERVLRLKERERSMREEHVDGGYLVTQGVYTGPEDFSKGVVRHLMIERRIAPFWRGLNEHSDSWTEYQLVSVARGRPLPAPDAIPDEDPGEAPKPTQPIQRAHASEDNLTVPITSRAPSITSDGSSGASPISTHFPPGAANSPPTLSPAAALSRGRSKTLASLTESSKAQQTEMRPREVQLPRDPFVNGQPLEAYLYKDASECPICFLYYPKYLNKTRCCDQAICSECFVQIKRPDPHPPEHASEPGQAPPTPAPGVPGFQDELVSEPAQCPYCNQPEFGVTYESPAFRKGLAYANVSPAHPLATGVSAMSSSSSIASGQSQNDRLPSSNLHRRTISVSATDPLVITTDRVRPDWHQKLLAARAHTARRSAAATALHTAAYLMGNRGHDSDGRGFGSFGRRGILRRASGADGPSAANPTQLNMLAMMSERYAAQAASREASGTPAEGESSVDASHRSNPRRRRMEDLEEMMMMEAIRLSLASEEDRKKREDKEAKKEAKKKDKENKKAEKLARKNSATLGGLADASSEEGAGSGVLSSTPWKSSKGKSAEQSISDQETAGSSSSVVDPQSHLQRARQQILPNEPSGSNNSTPHRPSHLRKLSNASSSASSLGESASESTRNEFDNASPPAEAQEITSAGANSTSPNLDPTFNFRSLAAMVGDSDPSLEPSVSTPMRDEAPPEATTPGTGPIANSKNLQQTTKTEADPHASVSSTTESASTAKQPLHAV